MPTMKLSALLIIGAALLAPMAPAQAAGADGSAGRMWNGGSHSSHMRKHVRMKRMVHARRH